MAYSLLCKFNQCTYMEHWEIQGMSGMCFVLVGVWGKRVLSEAGDLSTTAEARIKFLNEPGVALTVAQVMREYGLRSDALILQRQNFLTNLDSFNALGLSKKTPVPADLLAEYRQVDKAAGEVPRLFMIDMGFRSADSPFNVSYAGIAKRICMNSFYCVTFSTGNGQHAVGVYSFSYRWFFSSITNYLIFDPNFGEYKANTQQEVQDVFSMLGFHYNNPVEARLFCAGLAVSKA